MPEKKIRLTYRGTENPMDPNNLLQFPVDWKKSPDSPIIRYDDQNNKSYILDRLQPYPPKNDSYFDLQISPRYVKEKVTIIKRDGRMISRKEPKFFGPTTDVFTEIEGTIKKKKGKFIVVVDKDEIWSYTFIKEK
jgi:hypothetical protein